MLPETVEFSTRSTHRDRREEMRALTSSLATPASGGGERAYRHTYKSQASTMTTLSFACVSFYHLRYRFAIAWEARLQNDLGNRSKAGHMLVGSRKVGDAGEDEADLTMASGGEGGREQGKATRG